MANPSLSLRFTIFFSLSLAASSFKFSASLYCSPPSPSPLPKATAVDLLSVLGPDSSFSAVDPVVAQELRSCLKFLVPFTPDKPRPGLARCSVRNRLCFGRNDVLHRRSNVAEENELVWWPPTAVLELARLAVDSGGDPGAIHRALDPKMLPVPDVEGSKEDKCELTRTPYGRRFIAEELNSYFEFLFRLIESRGPKVGLDVSLTRFDLFHGHLFLAAETGRLGILFHAKEYPAYDKEVFPYNMGYCQIGSNITYDNSMNLRNILWLAPLPSNSTKEWLAPGVLVVLDARPDGIIYRDLIPDYVQFVRMIYEDEFGNTAVDVNYLNVGDWKHDHQLFIC